MPCSDNIPYTETHEYKLIVELTTLLCEACKLLSNPDQTDRMSTDLYAWKIYHDKMDADRIQKEQEGLL